MSISRLAASSVVAASLLFLASAPRAFGDPPPSEKPAADAPSAYDRLLAGATSHRGVVGVHAAKGRWYLEFPTELLGKDLLWYAELAEMPTTFVPKGVGVEIASRMVRLERVNDAIFVRDLTQPLSKRASPKQDPGEQPSSDEKRAPMQVSLGNASLPPALLAMPIAAIAPDGAILVDASAVFGVDLPDFSPVENLAAGGVKAAGLAPDRSYVRGVRAFPRNVEVSSFLTFRAAAPSAVSVVVRHSITRLPDHPMAPRLYDPRVGYFATAFDDYSGADAAGIVKRELINRYRLEKKDPAAAVSEPVQPIVYYIGRGVPARWRSYFKQAVEDWQVAFEAAGFSKAIVAKDAPTEAEDPTWDPSDTRYSVIRWLEQPVVNAMGPHTSDPRTGEILSAHVLIWSEVLTLAESWYVAQTAATNESARKLPLPDEVMGRLVRYIVGHEVGHSLGLRHNHRASQVFTIAQLRDPAFAEKYGPTPSIMSYGRFNYVAQPGDGVTSLVPRIGPYDLFAIQWGYAPIPGAPTPQAERATLDTWAARQRTEPFLAFGGEDLASLVDPNVLTENLGSDRIEATRLGLLNLERTLGYLVPATASPSGSFDRLESMYAAVLDHRRRWLESVIKLIGGVEENRALSGTGEMPFARVERARARAAVTFLLENLRTPRGFLPGEIVARVKIILGADLVAQQQVALLDGLLAPMRYALLADQGIVDPANSYALVDYLGDVQDGLFEELGRPSVAVDPIRRRLQRHYLDRLATQLATDDGETDFRAAARTLLARLDTAAKAALSRAADATVESHLRYVSDAIEGVLRAPGRTAPDATAPR